MSSRATQYDRALYFQQGNGVSLQVPLGTQEGLCVASVYFDVGFYVGEKPFGQTEFLTCKVRADDFCESNFR